MNNAGPTHTPRWVLLLRFAAVFVVSVLSLFVMAWILPGLSVGNWGSAVLVVGTIAVLNALLWPLVARYAVWLVVWTLGLVALVANGLILMLAAELVDEFRVSSIGTAMLASLGMTAIASATGSLLSLDDDAVWRRNVIRRMVERDGSETTGVAGVLFLQIDGLSESVLRQAMGEGYLPTLARWVGSGSHRIVGWECDLSSQTGASQAGILHGDNTDMPAFRWYDKATRKVMTSNHPNDAAEIERQRSNGQGLLADGGVSRANVFSGDSPDSLFTFSTVTDRSRRSGRGVSYFLADPYAISRIVVLSVADIGRELAAARRARRRGITPRMKRGGVYPLLRAATAVMLRDLTVYTLMSDIYRGVPSGYADFVGYDEVAHHSGIAAPDALETLRRLDQQFARLERAIAEGPRPYHVVILSDHGQTQGSTFLQRYGVTLSELVASLVDRSQQVDDPVQLAEGWGNLNGFLSDAIREEDSRMAGLLRTLVKRRTVDGEVVLGPTYAATAEPPEIHDVVVLASGNLGLISFPEMEGRATLEAIATRYPGILRGLVDHPGIGFVLVRSEAEGPLVISKQGIRYLDDGRIEGHDPLETFGPSAVDHLRRTDGFANTPDILVNSFYDADADEGAAFEELIGFHGGLGGKQAEPFLLFPRSFTLPDEPIVGAATVHHLFKSWLRETRSGSIPPPGQGVSEPEEPDALEDIIPSEAR